MKTLDDLKQEAIQNDMRIAPEEQDFVHSHRMEAVECAIDYLHAQGRIVPDGYVAVDAAKIPIKKPYIIFHHDTIGKTVTLDERTYLALNKCAVLLDKAMIAAAQKGDE